MKGCQVLNEENSRAIAKLALVEFGYDPETTPLTFVTLRENSVFRADTPDGSIALRIHRPNYRSHSEIIAESGFIDLLLSHGLPVVGLIPTIAGGFTALITTDDFEAVVDAQTWVEGSRQLGTSHDNQDIEDLHEHHFEQMGELAARMHLIAETIPDNHQFIREPWDGEGIVGAKALWGDALKVPSLDEQNAAILLRGRNLVLNRLAEVGKDTARYGLIHADFTPENILVTDSGITLIDFDDYGEGWYLFDLATALFFFLQHPSYDQFRAGLLRGYRGKRPLTEIDEELLETFLVARGFTYLGWAGSRPENPTSEFVVAEILPLVLSLTKDLLAKQSS